MVLVYGGGLVEIGKSLRFVSSLRWGSEKGVQYWDKMQYGPSPLCIQFPNLFCLEKERCSHGLFFFSAVVGVRGGGFKKLQ